MQTTDAVICSIAGITAEELHKAREIEAALNAPQDMMVRMMAMQSSGGKHPAGVSKGGGAKHPSWIPKMGKRPENTVKSDRTRDSLYDNSSNGVRRTSKNVSPVVEGESRRKEFFKIGGENSISQDSVGGASINCLYI